MNQQDLATARLVARIAHGYVLAAAKNMQDAFELDLGCSLVLLTTLSLNANGKVLLDDDRTPVSVYALARDLGMPYETARRHALTLCQRGYAQRLEAGLVVNEAGPQSAIFQVASLGAWAAAKTYAEALAAVGLAPTGATPDLTARAQDGVSLAACEHFLALTKLAMRALGLDIHSVLVQLAIHHANTHDITWDPKQRAFAGYDTVPPDSVRRPVTVYRLAKMLGLPYETARRNVERLKLLGYCVGRPQGGVIAPSALFARPDLMRGVLETAVEARKFLETLSRFTMLPMAGEPPFAPPQT